MSVIDYSQAGAAAQPSPSIWKNCPQNLLNLKGQGFYFHDDFAYGNEVFADQSSVGQLPWTVDGDAGATFTHRTGGTGGLQDIAVSNTDNNAVALFTQPLGKMVRFSGNQLWFEARYRAVSITEDRGVYFGFAQERTTDAWRDILADDVASVAAGLASIDLFGFTTQTDNKDDLQAVLRVGAGTPVTLKTDVTQSSALGTAAAALTAAAWNKFGIMFDGGETVFVYVNGIKVASQVLTSAQFPTTDLSVVANLKTGAAATATINFDWIRAGIRTRV